MLYIATVQNDEETLYFAGVDGQLYLRVHKEPSVEDEAHIRGLFEIKAEVETRGKIYPRKVLEGHKASFHEIS